MAELSQSISGLRAVKKYGLYKSANTVGIAVAVPRELDECKQEFLAVGAAVSTNGNVLEVDHEKYRAVIIRGKAPAGGQEVAKDLINEHKAKWLVMVGIAGSLRDAEAGTVRLGDVVIATSIAPYEIRNKEIGRAS